MLTSCPVNAIWSEDELPDQFSEWLDKNAELVAVGTNITQQTGQLDTARDLDAIQAEEKEKGWDISEPGGT